MRIAFVSGMSGFPWGGSEILWSKAAKKMADRNYSVLASVHHWPEPVAALEELKLSGVKVASRLTPSESLRSRIARKFGDYMGWPNKQNSAVNKSFQDLLYFSPNAACISHGAFSCGLPWMEWCRDCGVPYVSVAQCNFEGWWPSDEFAIRLRTAYQSASVAAFVSHANLQLFERQIGCELRNAVVVRNPVQLSSCDYVPWPTTATLKLACVGRLETAAKGQDLILQVLSMPKWRARDIHISFYGSGPNLDTLCRLADRLGVASKVNFAGQVSDVLGIWKTHHAMILPSRYEGLPLAVVEAMLCGRLAIVTDVAGNTEVVRDGHSGFVAESPTVKHVDLALDRAWNRVADWERLGANARMDMLPNYISPAEDQLIDLLIDLAR